MTHTSWRQPALERGVSCADPPWALLQAAGLTTDPRARLLLLATAYSPLLTPAEYVDLLGGRVTDYRWWLDQVSDDLTCFHGGLRW